ncbi:MAG: hypothetical protein HFF09_06565 [Oscillospiraceae bacterium]|nr:hypothetical protein [Oscillospiraceae bacterium]
MSTVRERLAQMKRENRPLTPNAGVKGGTTRQTSNVRARLEKMKRENKPLAPVSASAQERAARETAISRLAEGGRSGTLPLSPYGQSSALSALERTALERAAEAQESVASITAKRDAAGLDAAKAQAALQAAQAGGWLPRSGRTERVVGAMETLQRAQEEKKRQDARLKARAEQAQQAAQAARIPTLASEKVLQKRRDEAGLERVQAEARATAMLANPLTADMNEYAALRGTADRAGGEESRAKSDLALRRSVYVNEKEKAAAAALVKGAPVGGSATPDYGSAKTPEQKRAASTVRALLKPDAAAAPAAAGDAEGIWNALRLSMLTEEEKNAVLAYAGAGSWDKAAALLNNLERVLDERQQGKNSAAVREAARENPFAGALMNAVSTYAQPYAYLEGLKQAVHNAVTGEDVPINQNSFWTSGAHMTQDTAAGVVQGVNESIIGDIFGDVSFVTETGLSILQNMVRYPMGAASLPFMAVGAAGGGTLEGAQQGLSAGEAVALGTAAGLAEYVTEKVSLESLLNTVKAGATPLRRTLFNIGKQIVAEGSEEAASEYINLLADAIIMGDRNEMMQYSRDLQAQGFSKSEADAMAITHYMVEAPALSALGGALSGGIMGAGGAALGNALGRFNQWNWERTSPQRADAAIDAAYADMAERGVLADGRTRQAVTDAAIQEANEYQRRRGEIVEYAPEDGQQKTAFTGEAAVQADTSLFDGGILTNLNKARAYLIDFAHQHFPASVVNTETGKEIGISRKGLDKFLSGNLLYEKYASGFHIPELIERAHLVNRAENYHTETRDSIPAFEYYDSPITIGGKEYNAHIRVKNTLLGDKYYGHTVSEVDEIEIERPTRTSVEDTQTGQLENTGRSTSTPIIANDAMGGKRQFAQRGESHTLPGGDWGALQTEWADGDVRGLPGGEGMTAVAGDPRMLPGGEALRPGGAGGTIKQTASPLNEAEKGAVLRYKSGDSYKINAKLRSGEALNEQEQRFVEEMGSALAKLPTYEGTVYRNLTFDDFGGREAFLDFLEQYVEGKPIFYQAFTSTSTQMDGYPLSGENVVHFIIESQTARDVNGFGNNFESEAIFPRRTRFLVKRITQDSSGEPLIYMEEVTADGAGEKRT